MSLELQTGLILFGVATAVSWGIWITRSVMGINKNRKDYDDLEKKVDNSLTNHDKRQKEMEDRVITNLDNFNKTLHLWKDTMIDELKSIVKNERIDRGGQRTSK